MSVFGTKNCLPKLFNYLRDLFSVESLLFLTGLLQKYAYKDLKKIIENKLLWKFNLNGLRGQQKTT